MADGSTITHLRPAAEVLRLRDAFGAERHLVARCLSPTCRHAAPCDPKPWLAQGLGVAPLLAFSERLRCVCGGRRAALDVSPGAFAAAAHPDLIIFR